MKKAKVIPVENFQELFTTWPENETLSVKDIRLKAVTILALTLMLRNSDIASNGVIFYDSSGLALRKKKPLKNLVFEQNHMNVTFISIKNDAQRKGFEVILPKNNVVKIYPVQTLSDYKENTETKRSRWPCIYRLKISVQCCCFLDGIKDTREGYCFGRAIYQSVISKLFSSHRGDDCDRIKLESRDCQKSGQMEIFDHYVHSKTALKFCCKIDFALNLVILSSKAIIIFFIFFKETLY